MGNCGLIAAFSSDTTLSTPVAINKGGTGQTTAQAALDALAAASGSLVQGDIFIVDASTNVVRLARGSNDQTLMMNGSNPNWETVSAGGATVEAVSDRLGSTKTTTSSTLVVVDTGFTIDLPDITNGQCMVTANLVTQNSDSGSTATTSIYDFTNTAALTAMTTSGASGQSATQAITTDADGDTVRVYFSAPAGNTAYVLGSTGTGTSLESTGQISALGVG